jgi:hypothetical protein
MPQMNYFWLLITLSALIDVTACLFFISNPSGGIVRTYIAAEDGILENLTVVLYLLTFLFALVLLGTQSIKRQFDRKWLVLLLALGLIGFLEEISYGERLLSLEMPIVYNIKIDGVHDFVDVAINLIPTLVAEHLVPSLLIALGVLVMFVVAIGKYRKTLWNAATTGEYRELYLVMFFLVGLACGAVILDSDLFPFKGDLALEECFELNFALALVAACFIIYKINANKSQPMTSVEDKRG